MNDADAECDIELIVSTDLVSAAILDLRRFEVCKVALRSGQRAIVDIDAEARRRSVGMWPVGIAADAAADVQESFSPPVVGIHAGRPAAELLLVHRQDLMKLVPGITESFRRSQGFDVSLLVHSRIGSFREWPAPAPVR